ncbi:MAG: hypothetical protein QXI71_02105 [Candidatus Bathyarchaeia archaeon]|nr:hypothetical protein [Candidatus Bathyarchaeota archaeon]
MNLNGYLEILVLAAISIELYALYNHTKLDKRMDKHINDTNVRLEESDRMIKVLDEHIIELNKHITRLDKQMNKMDERIDELNGQMIKYSEEIKTLNKINNTKLKSSFSD